MAEGSRADQRTEPVRSLPGDPAPLLARCPVCGTPLPPDHLADHLRQAHRLYPFRGEHRPLNETLVALMLALCRPRPDLEVWPALEAIARAEYGGRADAFLAASVGQAVVRTDPAQRPVVLSAVAEAITDAGGGAALLPLLAADGDRDVRLFAVEIAARLPPPLPPAAVQALRPVLVDRRLPADNLVALAAALVRTLGKEGEAAGEVYGALTAGLGKTHSVELLRRLEERIGTSATLNELCARLEARRRMVCPRCGVQLRRQQMVGHLWDEHQLLLDGHRVREPWQLVEDWVEDYRRGSDAEALERCRLLGQRLDPENGLQRVQRVFLARGIDDEEARRTLLAEAQEQGGSLCPHCYALVPMPGEVPLRPLNVWHGRLSLEGYRVEVAEGGLFTRLEVETPVGYLYRDFEPERRLTQDGAVMFLAGPLVLAALLFAFRVVVPHQSPLAPVVLLLGAAVGAAVVARYLWPVPTPATDRAVDYAWELLVPRLHAGGYARADSAFAAGLAVTSMERGSRAARARPLARLLGVTEKAVAAGQGVVEHLADLHRLALTDAARGGADPVALVVEQVGRCFDGELSLAFAERLLCDWEADWWARENLARLRVLLCDRAFEAGFEVVNLVEAGRAAPSLGAVLDTDDREELARLRLLWSWRPRRPWDICGEAETVFDLAGRAEVNGLLGRYPDLLLAQQTGQGGRPNDEDGDRGAVTTLVCGRGVVFQGQLFTDPPRTIEVLSHRPPHREGYEVLVDGHVFRFRREPDAMVARLERWCRFAFHEFLPQVPAVHGWRSPGVAATLRARETVPCPDCHRPVIARAGRVGLALETE
jgi:hypothetical protein